MIHLVTGVAGFIGYTVALKLLNSGERVIGIDNMNNYYAPKLKYYRLEQLKKYNGFTFYLMDIEDRAELSAVFRSGIDDVIHLAARVGVRDSLRDPGLYVSTNIRGTINLLELMLDYEIDKMVLASSSSLYTAQSALGGMPIPSREDLVVTPISPYAITKRAVENLAYSYHHLHGLNIAVLRYFTVYGPAGRPDMSYFKFIRGIYLDKEIYLYGSGRQARDFTYVDDIVDGTIKALNSSGYEIYNLGSSKPYTLLQLISIIERLLKREAKKSFLTLPNTKIDEEHTWANNSKAKSMLDWEPSVSLENGLVRTVKWFVDHRDLTLQLEGGEDV